MEDNQAVPGSEFAGRYTIERELGRGGAAIVYLARDNRQERQVALKVLHRELAQAIGAQRFLREIKHSSSLHHPHLLAIHESGEFDGLLYYVMPYMGDGSLRTRIAKEKQLSIDESLRITRQVGEALAYAHSRGIVHRDIKPDNVLFSADHACLADFGIARAIDAAAPDTLTSTGLVVGTPAYMSPEQASGEKEVNARSDQYSLACLLYEMITGLPPFIGATMQSVISQRFTQPPPSMRAHRPSVPDHVERAVKRALAAVPADRYASVTEFIAALHDPTGAPVQPAPVHAIRRRWFAAGAAAVIVMLAVMAAGPGSEWVRGAWGSQVDTTKFVVLPFLSEEDPALGKRVATEVYAALHEWDGLALEEEIAVRDAVDRIGPVTTLREAISLSRKMGAGRLVWGTVHEDGVEARVVLHLYDSRSSAGLMERVYTGPAGSLSDSGLRALSNELIAGKLPAGVDDGTRGTRSYSALQRYRLGMLALRGFDLQLARTELRKTVELDPDFAVAQLELARVESWLQQSGSPTWIAGARRAVALNGELRPRDAKRSEALLAYAQDDYTTACRNYRELIASDTLDARAWYGLGECMHEDDVVVPDPRSRSGFSFRSSWHAAGGAFLRALEIEPGLHAVPHFRRIGQIFPTGHNQIRYGKTAQRDAVAFGAVPLLTDDTLAYTPYPMPNFERERDDTARALRFRALERNRRILLDLSATWARRYPRSSAAHTALASIHEVRGDFEGAARSLTTARSLAKDAIERPLLAEAEARVRYKGGDFAAARSVADSAVTSLRETTEANWEVVARLAGLTGNAARLADALQYFWPKYADVPGLDQGVSRAAGRALAHAVLGICDADPPAVARRLQDLIRIHVQPDKQGEVSDKVVGFILSFSVPCASGRVLGNVLGPGDIVRAQRAFSAGDQSLARSILGVAARGRAHLRAADVSPMLLTREASLLLALGDTLRAVERIDGMLRGLPAINASLLRYPLETGVLVRMMVTRADLAVAAADSVEARKWAQAVAILWSESDPLLRPTVARMRKIASGNR